MRLRRFVPIVLLVLAGHFACDSAPLQEEVTPATAQLVASNSLSSNGLFQNGLFQNGLFQNGLFQNGLLAGEFWQNSFWQKSPAALDVLRENPNAREFLQYTFSCAKKLGQTVELDLGPGSVPKKLKLEGLIGLADEWGGEGGSQGGGCNERCQRRVTACLLARTNAYGVKVDISMREPDESLPGQAKGPLWAEEPEREEYALFEGAFYGNIFEQTLRQGVAVMTPHLFACSGRGSSLPELTRRFNASQGAGGPIEVVGPCQGQDLYPRKACDVSGDQGALTDCYASTNPDRQGQTRYKEVITTYLKQPSATCGNAVCEEGEEGNPGCPSDCPPGWAKSFPAVLTQGGASSAPDHRLTLGSWARTSALSPDNAIVLAGVAPTAVVFDGNAPPPAASVTATGVVAKFGLDNTLRWSQRFDIGKRAAQVAVAVNPGPDHHISVLLNERQGSYESAIRVVRFDQDGKYLWSKSFGETSTTSSVSANALAVGPNGDLFIAVTLSGSMDFGPKMLEASPQTPREFVLKLSAEGKPLWAARFDGDNHVSLGARAIKVRSTPQGGLTSQEVVVSLRHGAGGAIWKLNPDGTTQWQQPGIYGGVAFGPEGKVYATGALEASPRGYPDFEPPLAVQNGDLFVVTYDGSTGAPAESRVLGSLCSDPTIPCAYRWFTGREIAFTNANEMLLGVRGGRRSTVELGSGPFRGYETDDLFVVALSLELQPLWSKQLSMILDGTLGGMHFGLEADNKASVVVSGTYAGSMLVNGRMLVTEAPQLRSVGSTFLASFALPEKTGGVSEPKIVTESWLEPSAFTIEATSVAGTKVFYTPPLATDDDREGVTVVCSPPSNAVFAIGPTTVTCFATDPQGHQTQAKPFTVQVIDKGPVFAEPPSAIVVAPAGTGDTPVTFAAPRAVDLVDGDRPVTCTPPSGTSFKLGTTDVSCRAQDSHGTGAEMTFPVHVRYGGLACGNGTVEPGEQCDDGNHDENDGCTSACVRKNRAPECSGASASPAFLLASTGLMWAPIVIEGVTDPDGDQVTITATKIRQDEPVSLLWCPSGTCADATLEPLVVRAERDTWAEDDPQPDGRVYHIEFEGKDPQGAQCMGLVTVCVQRRHDVMMCGDGGPLFNSVVPLATPAHAAVMRCVIC